MKTSRRLFVLRLALAVLGVALAIAVPARIGFTTVLASVRPALSVLPLCVACELVRVLCEACATRLALGRTVPHGPMLLAHLGSYAAGTVFPAPRPAAEAVKTSVLGEYVGVPEAASAGATMQAATFFAVGSMCLLAGLTTLGTKLSWVLFGNTAMLFATGLLLRVVMRSARAVRWIQGRWPRRAETLGRLHAVARTGHVLALGPSGFLLLGLFVRVFEQYFITRSMGGAPSVLGAISAEGVRLIGASVGVLVPGQLGVREAIFAMSADALGTTVAKATAVAVFTHVVELSLALIGFVALLFFRPRTPFITPDRPPVTPG